MTSSETSKADGIVDRLSSLYKDASSNLQVALDRYLTTGSAPTPEERRRFRYPELRVSYAPSGLVPTSPRAFAKFSIPGTYTTTITQPEAFRAYLVEQLTPLMEEFNAVVEVHVSEQEIPYPYVFERGDELARGTASAADLALHFPTPHLAEVGDEIADGLWDFEPDRPRPLALFDAARTDFSLRRIVHYTGTDWRTVQPWILLTNYHRYVDQFIRRGINDLRSGSGFDALVLPGGARFTALTSDEEIEALFRASPWQRFQMPAYHLTSGDRQGITLVNIGVGPANAKNITDHLAVLRPNAWFMVGHCGGLRQSQRIGDYVLAHAYLREDGILDTSVPPEIPIPALAEVQVALQEAAALVTGESGEALKRRLRTGTVVTYDDRNWELRWSRERRRINLSRAIAVDMESGTIAAQGFRFRVPYGTLLCVSDKPLHGEIKLPGAANAFYERAVSEHLEIGIAALGRLKGLQGTAHSRKLRSFDEPPFR